MPHRPTRRHLCSAEPTCGNLTAGGPCPDHDPRAPTAARGYGGPHQTIAAQLRERHPDGPCGRCGLPGTWHDPADPLTAGHIDPDGPTTLGNYQPEHRSCGNREMNRRRSRR